MPSNKKTIAHGLRSAIVGVDDVQTLTQKTMVSPIVTGGTFTGAVLTDPTITGGASIITDATTSIVDDADPTKVLKFELSGFTTATTNTITVPDSSDTMVLLAETQTLAGKTLTTPVLGVATATSINKVAITAPATSATLTIPNGVTLTGPATSGTAATLAGTETLTNKTLTAPTVSGIQKAGATSATAGHVQIVNHVLSAMTDATGKPAITIVVPNADIGVCCSMDITGSLGDGDSTHTALFNVSFSRITGAATLYTLGAAAGGSTTTGATANAVVALTDEGLTGANSVAQTITIGVKITRSAGASSNHKACISAKVMQTADGGVVVGTV